MGPLTSGVGPLKYEIDPLRHEKGPLSPVMGSLRFGMDPLRPGMGPLRPGDGPFSIIDHLSSVGPVVDLDPLRHEGPPSGLCGPLISELFLFSPERGPSCLKWALLGLAWAPGRTFFCELIVD